MGKGGEGGSERRDHDERETIIEVATIHPILHFTPLILTSPLLSLSLTMAKERQRKVLVIGGGPVGALTALSLYRRGWSVELWEARQDPRGKDERITNLRSINLAISSRGLEALRSVDPSLGQLHLPVRLR